MDKYIKITPEMVWTPPGVKEIAKPTPTGCSFIDVLSAEIRRRGHCSASYYADVMGVSEQAFTGALEVLTGMTAWHWIDRLVTMDNEWLLLNTTLKVSAIAKRQGYTSVSVFARAWRKRTRLSPTDYRNKHRIVYKRVVNEIKVLK